MRVAQSVLQLHRQLKAGAPRAAPPATRADEWGTAGDILHDLTSDHAAKDFPGWGNDIITAGDFPNRPDLGLDAHRVLDDIRRSRDVRAKYGISNDEIFSNHPVDQDGVHYPAWTWRPYLPHDATRDRHRTHGHLSVVGDVRADNPAPWATIGGPTAGEDDDMGASFGPIDIRQEGFTSLSIPPVEAGLADPRAAWLNVTNDTGGSDYGLRVWWGGGQPGDWKPLGATGLYALRSGGRLSVSLPPGCVVLTIKRMALGEGGKVIEPTADVHPYAGHLTCCIERGPVIG